MFCARAHKTIASLQNPRKHDRDRNIYNYYSSKSIVLTILYNVIICKCKKLKYLYITNRNQTSKRSICYSRTLNETMTLETANHAFVSKFALVNKYS